MSTDLTVFDGFNKHPTLDGSHAILSPSNYHWLNYSEERLLQRLQSSQAAVEGSELHLAAALLIKHGLLLMEAGPSSKTLWLYVNDCINFGMVPEQPLFYSMHCYGTADAIGFDPFHEDPAFGGYLRVSDLKTGLAKASHKQLYVYAGLFCLEYGYEPYKIDGQLTIYQNGKRDIVPIDRNFLAFVMDKIEMSVEVIERRGGRS